MRKKERKREREKRREGRKEGGKGRDCGGRESACWKNRTRLNLSGDDRRAMMGIEYCCGKGGNNVAGTTTLLLGRSRGTERSSV